VKFTFPTKLPWTTRGTNTFIFTKSRKFRKLIFKNVLWFLGICAVNSVTALSLDNSTTHNFKLDQDCYTIALADCSSSSRFIVGIKMNTVNSTLVSYDDSDYFFDFDNNKKCQFQYYGFVERAYIESEQCDGHDSRKLNHKSIR